ncbi:hypothetical protein [Streptomyces niveus]|uniref:hypothetical protein n=1 Tax=Streptomyces niveus TaxID=193462 RepID=UPI003660E9D7
MSEIDFDDDTDTVWDSYLLESLLDPDGANDGATRAPSAAALYVVDEEGVRALAGAISIRDADTYDDATEFFEADAASLFALLENEATGAVVTIGGTDYRMESRETIEDADGGAVPVAHLRDGSTGIVLAAIPDLVVAGYYDESRKNTRTATAEAVGACARSLREDLSL